jgi:hypothetical protein
MELKRICYSRVESYWERENKWYQMIKSQNESFLIDNSFFLSDEKNVHIRSLNFVSNS